MKILDDGIELDAIQTLPDNYREGEKFPLLILIHGFTGHKEEDHLMAIAEGVRSIGFATLQVDMYGHGMSGGSFCEHTLLKWINNTITIVDYARKQDFVSDIWLCGHSQGGCDVMLAAPIVKDRIRGILPLSPAWHIPQGARDGLLLSYAFDPENLPEGITLQDGEILGGNYLRVARTLDAEAAIDGYDGPVLIVHGTADESVPMEWGERAAKRYKNATFIPIEGDTHCFDYHTDRLRDAVRDWLAQHNKEL